MSEEYPLLYEDLSEEDKFVPRFHRRGHMSVRGRARNQVKGAAAIIKQWPEYWTTILAYWWIGLAMIALTTLIVYNTVFSLVMFHPTNTKPIKPLNGIIKHYKSAVKSYDVYMHVFLNGTEAVDLNKYFPYIDIVANENKDFKFHFVLVLNDTNEQSNISEEMNNKVAMKTILTNDKNEYKRKNTIFLEHVSLSRYLDTSPIQKYWRSLPKQFVTFLVRAVSVWEKGGIAVNPVVFTPQSPSPIYIEKINKIFEDFKISDNKTEDKVKDSLKLIIKKVRKVTPIPNNIQDILNEFENHDISSYDPPTLEVAESRHVISLTKDNNSVSELHYLKGDSTKSHLYHLNDKINAKGERKSHTSLEKDNASNVPKILPLFLNYLFHNDLSKNASTETETATTSRIRRRTTSKVIYKVEKEKDIKSNEMFKPMIVKAKGIVNDLNASLVTKKPTDEKVELTVDLKGNLIATKTPCHAFVGDMFTNAVHHDESETLTDFIIKELSIFCKGLLTSCGIDVVLI